MPSSDVFSRGWIIFVVMVGVMLLMLLWRRQPIGIALFFGALFGAIVNGDGVPVRQLVEGAFTYFDPLLIIFTALVFMRVIQENGALGALAAQIVRNLGGKPALLLIVVTVFIMFPAMLTGISTTSVLTTGAIMAAPLIALGMPPVNVAALIMMVSIMGMIAPPINLIAMLIGQGVDMPFIGFEGPLAALAFPLAFLSAFALGYRRLKRGSGTAALNGLPEPAVEIPRWRLYLPLILVLVLMSAVRLFPAVVPDVGIPLIFAVGAAVGLVTGNRVNLLRAAYRALLTALPVLTMLAGIGMFLQIMTLNGVRGLLVVSVLGLPAALTFAGMFVSLPVFGGVSAFASGMVFGIPFLLALLGRNEIVVCAGISLLAGLGDALPPSAIGARFAAQAAGDVSYMAVIKKSVPLLVISALAALAMVYWAKPLGFLTP